ncbi:MAG: M1 family metallopeptidase, partial [Candidatus Kariarchaeaceae archaeon]
GDFDIIEDKLKEIDVRLLATPGNASKYGQFGLDFGIKSLKYCINYYDIEYPLSKMDLIATPDFAHGAMENWGAILFRENLLLHFPGVTSNMGETRIEEVIAHEVAHQWFGNLVSPASWKYLWLNESFATYFGFGVIDHYYPKKHIWEYFLQTETDVALSRDGFLETTAIEKPGDGAVGMTIKNAPILYNKGGSILRMIESYLGKEEFRNGLRKFLKDHAYDVAESDDLWIALEEVSGKPINDLMKSWILQDGYPLIEAKKKGNILYLSQKRFTYLPNQSYQKWIVPISIQLHYSQYETETIYTLLENDTTEIQLREDVTSFKINTELSGFYRVKYEVDDYEVLGKLIRDKVISPIDRWSVENDLYAMLRSKEVSLDDYLNIIPFYYDEENHLGISSISNHLRSLYLLFDEPIKSRIAEIGKSFTENILYNIGYEPIPTEHRNISSIRGRLIFNAVGFSSEKAEKYALNKFEEIKMGKNISPDLIEVILQIGAGKTNDGEWFKQKLMSAENEAEKLNYIRALGKFTDKKLIEEMQFYIFDQIPARNRSTAIASLSLNPYATETLWYWYLANLDNFEKLHPYMYQQVLTVLVPRCVDHKEDIISFFKDYLVKNPQMQDAIDVALEIMEINARVKNAFS